MDDVKFVVEDMVGKILHVHYKKTLDRKCIAFADTP